MTTSNRRILACVVTLLAAGSIALGQTKRAGGSEPAVRRAAPTTLKLLDTRVPEVAFQGVPLEQVMDWLADFTGVNVTVRWETLAAQGIEKDKPITIKVKNLRLSQVLWLLMSEAGGPDVKLAYRATGNLIILSTHEELGKDMITRVYDVSDMLVRVPRFTNAANLNPAQALNQAGQGGGGGGGGGGQLFEDNDAGGGGEGGAGREGGADANASDVQVLITLIQDTVEPDTWVANGGLGTIFPLRGQIIVRNNILVHQLLGGPIDEGTVSR